MRFDFFDLKLMLHIHQTGSITQAAEHSAISLQAASERLKKLEQQCGTALFLRQYSGVSITPAGLVFVQHAKKLLEQKHQLEQDMQRFTQLKSESLVLWCNSSAQSEYLPMLLPQFLMQHPHINIDLHEAESSEIVEALSNHTAQLGLVSSFFNTAHLQTQAFSHDPLVLICAKTHDLAKVTQLDLVTVLSHEFIGLKQHHSLQKAIENQAKSLGFQIQYRLRLPNFSAIAEVVAKGVGIAIIPARAAQRLKLGYPFQTVTLTGDWANRQLLLASADFQKLSPSYQQFASFLIAQKPAATHLK
ncbi:MAG: LysR family transcriptional regulator [Acinetobacter sp.]